MDDRAAESVLTFAEKIGPELKGPDAKAAFGRLEERHADLLAAIQWFVENRRTDDALRLANALYSFWITKQRFDEGSVWLDRVLGSPGGDDARRGTALIGAGFMAFWKAEDDRAASHFGQALEIARRIEDLPMVSRAFGGLARVALRSNVDEGRKLAREALDVSEQAADVAGRSNAMHLLGVGAQIAGDLLDAREWMTRRLALVRELNNEALISSEASNLSMVERQLGHLDAAEALVREAMEIAERRGDDFMKPFTLSGLAAIAIERGKFERAATLIGAAEAIMEARGAAWPPDERPHYERAVLTLTETLGKDGFGRLRANGRAMSSSEAVKLALGANALER